MKHPLFLGNIYRVLQNNTN